MDKARKQAPARSTRQADTMLEADDKSDEEQIKDEMYT